MKGLPKEYASFTTLVKLSKEEKGLEEINWDLINCDNENVHKKSELYSTKNGNASIVKRSDTWLRIFDSRRQIQNK